MTRKLLEIGSERLTATAVKRRFQEIRDKYTGGYRNNVERGVYWPLDKEETLFVAGALRYRPDYSDVEGRGLAGIKITVVPAQRGRYQHWGFAVIRVDGSEQITGFGDIGKRAELHHRGRAIDAMRAAVADQVMAYKEAYFDGQPVALCEATGQEITPETCEVDHLAPATFLALRTEFFGDDPASVEICHDGLAPRILDKELRDRWAEFHRSRCVLRCVTPAANPRIRSNGQCPSHHHPR